MEVNKKVVSNIALVMFLCVVPELAFAVNKADSGINSVNTWMGTIVPIIFGCGLLILSVLYGLGIVGKNIFQQIFTGLILGGCASWLVSLFF